MNNMYLDISPETIDSAVKIVTAGIIGGIGWMIKRQLKLQEKQHQIQQEQAKDISEIKGDFKITNLRYDSLEGRVTKVETDVEKIKEKV
jgi:hypothetical protein